MIPLTYSYLVFSLIFAIPWLVLFLIKPNLRKSMILMGVWLILAGIVGQTLLWRNDWWNPQTISNTLIGFEDILHGFTAGGVAVAIFSIFSKKKFYPMTKTGANNFQIVGIIVASFIITSTLFWALSMHSFYATLIGTTFMWLVLIMQRRELFLLSLKSGFFLMIWSILVFIIINFLSPEFISSTWQHASLSGIYILYAPLEDVLFYFSTGAVVLPFYLYWKNIYFKK